MSVFLEFVTRVPTAGIVSASAGRKWRKFAAVDQWNQEEVGMCAFIGQLNIELFGRHNNSLANLSVTRMSLICPMQLYVNIIWKICVRWLQFKYNTAIVSSNQTLIMSIFVRVSILIKYIRWSKTYIKSRMYTGWKHFHINTCRRTLINLSICLKFFVDWVLAGGLHSSVTGE